ncbi:hypothetical protein OHV10_21545 [Vibrio splendidus]|uniref:hypothetical protein n=1 Tax=Vibrio splendidus TaxID=29497 RepID=UPI002235A30B|nr:hypothetical protein [Vibrio splendidus]MCW4446828.1 hypothetical protein [Vibrio splendidus]
MEDEITLPEADKPQPLTGEENAFLNELDEEFVPPEMGNESASMTATDSAQMTALFGLNMTEGLLKQFAHSGFSFDETQKENTAAALAPALAKYNGQLPPWLEPYKEEVFALLALGTLGFTSYAQIKALKALDASQSSPETAEEDTANEAN